MPGVQPSDLSAISMVPSEPVAVTPPPARSFEDFYRLSYSASVRLAFGLTGDLAVAEEYVQDAFVTAHERWPTVTTYDRPDLWLRRVVINLCVSGFRRRRNQSRAQDELRQRRTVAVELPEKDDELWRAVRRLPQRQAQAIVLVYVEDLSVRDTAEVLGCSEDTVRTHLRRGRSALSQVLGDANDSPREAER